MSYNATIFLAGMMIFEYILIGSTVGMLSGFFGIGGGVVLVPVLLLLGLDIKSAIAISVVQMSFSSVFGSIINYHKGTLRLSMVSLIGVGGLFGAQLSGVILSSVSSSILEFFFLGAIVAALSMLYLPPLKEQKQAKRPNIIILLFIGAVIGALSISLGVGGSFLLVPILVGILHIPIKEAISAGLFFVVFSSLSGVTSLAMRGMIDLHASLAIAISAMVGVFVGIYFKDKIDEKRHKLILKLFYMILLAIVVEKVFIDG